MTSKTREQQTTIKGAAKTLAIEPVDARSTSEDIRPVEITGFVGLPGSGKSARLIELVNARLEQGRPALTFACNESPWLTARESVRVNRLLGCRVPGLLAPLHHLVSTEEGAAILDQTPPGTLVAFDEAHAFGTAIVPHWISAARRGIEVIIAMPSQPQRELLRDHPYRERHLEVRCERCAGAPASTFVIIPGADATLTVCASCAEKMTEAVHRDLLVRLEAQRPYPGEKALYQPIELEECADWRLLRPDSSARADIMARVIREAGLLDDARPDRTTYLDVGCNTGYFCHRMRQLGLFAQGVDVVEDDISVARILDSFVRKDNVSYVLSDAYDYLRDTQDQMLDVTSAFSVFQWVMIQKSVDHGIACLEWLFAKTRRICFVEMGYSSESHYQGQIGVEIDRAWVLNIMERAGGFSEIRVFDAEEHGLMRDFFVGLKDPASPTERPNGTVVSTVSAPEHAITRTTEESKAASPVAREARAESSTSTPTAPDREQRLPEDGDLVERIRQVVDGVIGPDATVLVVSKGDDRLLDLRGRRAWHFPRSGDGRYAGYYPADGVEAVSHLEALRKQGGEYLLFPQTAFWWLDHYAFLTQHLATNYPLLVRGDACLVYDLRSGPPSGPRGHERGETAEHPSPGNADRPDISWEGASAALREYVSRGAHTEEVGQLLTDILPRYMAAASYRTYFPMLEARGAHLTPVHHYSPIPDTRTLTPEHWRKPSSLSGIDLNEAGQVRLVRDVFRRFEAEYGRLPTERTATPHQFYLGNSMFDGTDALALYCMVRHLQPNRIIEVGSGFSSRLCAQAALLNGHTTLTSIEPFPDSVLRQGFPGLTELIDRPAQDVGDEIFGQLGPGDILFIDSSHVAKAGSDVNYLLLEVIPSLKPGVVIHVHDVFFPFDYRQDWILDEYRFWNEQYVLQAFLAYNREYEVLLSNSYMGWKHHGLMKATFPSSPWWGGGSFWMRRIGASVNDGDRS